MEKSQHAAVIPLNPKSTSLEIAYQRFEAAMEARLRTLFAPANEPAPSVSLESWTGTDETPYGNFLREHKPDREAQLLLMLALAPQLKPEFFDALLHHVHPGAGDFPQFGGIRGKQHRGFLPTGDTALFLLAGNDLEARMRWQKALCGEHFLVKKGVIRLEDPVEGDPPMSARLALNSDYADLFIGGATRAPRTSLKFPAWLMETAMEWGDVVLPARTLMEVKELETWVRHGDVLLDDWNMRRKLRPGCRALFFGPPGTGKTLTASLLGKTTGRPVYRVDLSMVVSKYIGETEKNLAALFDQAENKDWILFFDEADALFGKRSQVRDAHDRYANQEVSFLLQRIETCNGLVILASNLAGNVDEAFARRFELLVHYPMPRQNERLLLWKKGLPGVAELEPGVDLGQLAARHEMSGGMIMNVIRFVSMQAISRGETVLRQRDFVEGIRREFSKENRLV
jgi:hypothetical protein